jgi:tRNA(Ile)-lysidine synthetase-like protein
MASSGGDVVATVRRAVREALDRHDLLSGRRRIVVAVSGGADSLCLLDALAAVVPDPGRRLFVGHIDHQLRPESAADAEHVKQVALGLGVPGTVDTVNVAALAKAERLGIEEAARRGRYRSLSRMADDLGTDIVLTGHTRDDFVETVVLRILRGAGTHGLSGIAEVERFSASAFDPARGKLAPALRVVRPLLQVGRTETVAYCEARGIRWLIDPSNTDPAFTRNRVRAHLLPVLRTYNPAIDRALVRMAQVVGDEDAWLDEVAVQRLSQLRDPSGDDHVLNLSAWQRQPVPIQRRLVRMIADPDNVHEIGFEAVERALAVGRPDGPPRVELGHGIAVERRTDTVVFVVQPSVQHD